MHAESCPNRARPRIRPQIKGGPFDLETAAAVRAPISGEGDTVSTVPGSPEGAEHA